MQAKITAESGNCKSRTFHIPNVPVVPMTAAARVLDEQLMHEELELKRQHLKTQFGAIVARRCEQTRRLALIRSVSRDPFAPVVEESDLAWGARVVVMSQAALMAGVEAHVADTQHEAMLKKVLEIIRRHGDWMDGSMLSRKTQFLKVRDRSEVILQLEESRQIEVSREKSLTKPSMRVRAVR